MEMETVQRNYGVTNEDLAKIMAYTSQSTLEDNALKNDYENKRWLVSQPITYPPQYLALLQSAHAQGFDISSDEKTGSLLSVLTASKPNGHFLEIGTGCGLGTSWLLQGMDTGSHLTTVETNTSWLNVAQAHVPDTRVTFVHGDASEIILSAKQGTYDLIFADGLPGKYFLVDETIRALKKGGFYVVDDCIHQEKWPKEVYLFHRKLMNLLEQRNDLQLITIDWAVGITLGVKTK